jgi:hypothetical protein
MFIYVQFQNSTYDIVDGPTLDRLLAGRALQRFYRRSEERWVDVYRDRIRGLGGDYTGPNRRHPDTISKG